MILPQDRRAEHVKFQKHAHELMERVSGPAKRKNYDNNDITLDLLHRASVVANTRIRWAVVEGSTGIHEISQCPAKAGPEKTPTRAFSLLKAPISAPICYVTAKRAFSGTTTSSCGR